jgi:hypothetical protein
VDLMHVFCSDPVHQPHTHRSVTTLVIELDFEPELDRVVEIQ